MKAPAATTTRRPEAPVRSAAHRGSERASHACFKAYDLARAEASRRFGSLGVARPEPKLEWLTIPQELGAELQLAARRFQRTGHIVHRTNVAGIDAGQDVTCLETEPFHQRIEPDIVQTQTRDLACVAFHHLESHAGEHIGTTLVQRRDGCLVEYEVHLAALVEPADDHMG